MTAEEMRDWIMSDLETDGDRITVLTSDAGDDAAWFHLWDGEDLFVVSIAPARIA